MGNHKSIPRWVSQPSGWHSTEPDYEKIKYESGSHYYIRFSRLHNHDVKMKSTNGKTVSCEFTFADAILTIGSIKIPLAYITEWSVDRKLKSLQIHFIGKGHRDRIKVVHMTCENADDISHDIQEACDILHMYLTENGLMVSRK